MSQVQSVTHVPVHSAGIKELCRCARRISERKEDGAMRKLMMWVAGSVLLAGGALQAQDLSGNWQGTLQAGKGLRTVLKVSKDGDKLKAVMYSVDQGGRPM